VPVDEHEDVVDNRPVQFLSLETNLGDFVYLIDSNGRHPSSLRWLKRVERTSLARAPVCAHDADRFVFVKKIKVMVSKGRI
jgi:hypothetical protein